MERSNSEWASPPCETLIDLLEERYPTLFSPWRTPSYPIENLLADITLFSPKLCRLLLTNELAIDPAIAARLEHCGLGIAEFWNQRQFNYEIKMGRPE